MSTINIEFLPELDSRKRYGTHAHLMALSRHIASALFMRMWHAKNYFGPLLRTQYTLNFSTKYAANTKYIKVFTRITQNARNQRTSDGFVASS